MAGAGPGSSSGGDACGAGAVSSGGIQAGSSTAFELRCRQRLSLKVSSCSGVGELGWLDAELLLQLRDGHAAQREQVDLGKHG